MGCEPNDVLCIQAQCESLCAQAGPLSSENHRGFSNPSAEPLLEKEYEID